MSSPDAPPDERQVINMKRISTIFIALLLTGAAALMSAGCAGNGQSSQIESSKSVPAGSGGSMVSLQESVVSQDGASAVGEEENSRSDKSADENISFVPDVSDSAGSVSSDPDVSEDDEYEFPVYDLPGGKVEIDPGPLEGTTLPQYVGTWSMKARLGDIVGPELSLEEEEQQLADTVITVSLRLDEDGKAFLSLTGGGVREEQSGEWCAEDKTVTVRIENHDSYYTDQDGKLAGRDIPNMVLTKE